MLDIHKMIQVVNHVIDRYEGTINYTKLIKELYLADKKCLLKHGYSISENQFVCMKFGPVLEDLYQLIRQQYPDKAVQAVWDSYYYTSSRDLIRVSGNRLPEDRLSANEITVLDEVDGEYHSWGYSALIDLVHNRAVCPETINTDSSIPLSYSTVMAKAGVSAEDIAAWESDESLQDSLDRIFA